MATASPVDLTQGLCWARAHDGVAEGCCAVFIYETSAFVYAGPLVGAPRIEGRLVVLHPKDFERLRAVQAKSNN